MSADTNGLNRQLHLLSAGDGQAASTAMGTRQDYLELYASARSTVQEALSEGVCTTSEALSLGRYSLEPALRLLPLDMSGLQPGHWHLGRCLLVRVAQVAFKLKAVCSVVEGPCGGLLYMAVHHLLPTQRIMGDASSAMPQGALLLVKVRPKAHHTVNSAV